MSRGVNKVIIVGNLGQGPETRYTQNSVAVTTLSVATSYKPKNGDEQTEWHRVVLWQRLAEVAAEHLRKGSKVYVEGRLQTRKWQDKDGNDRWSTEVVAHDMQMLDSRSSQGASSRGASPPADNWGGNEPQGGKPALQKPQQDFDDDIPF